MAEILCQRGKYHEAESICANVLARQRMNIGEDHLDTLETRRQISMAYNALGRRENAVSTAEKPTDSCKRLLEDNHIRVFGVALDMLDYIIYHHDDSSTIPTFMFQSDVQRAFGIIPSVHEELLAGLGRTHPLTIRVLSSWSSTHSGAAAYGSIRNSGASARNFRRVLWAGASTYDANCWEYWCHVCFTDSSIHDRGKRTIRSTSMVESVFELGRSTTRY